ncbi:MAG TPA: hypothetical protein VFS89_03860 [Nitrosospira sp.]|nr:hypothetical protein [Nitrosospira sp.]
MATELTDEQIANLTPEQIEELENNPDADINPEKQETATQESGDEPEQAEEGAANGEGETDEEEKKPVVLTKNGKGNIPYEKYQGLRVENATLREQLQGLQKAQTELESLREAKANAGTPERRAEIQKKLVDRIATMKEDFPDIGSSLESVNELITDLQKELAEERAANKAKAEAEQAKKESTIAEQVQEAKENNPDLLHWETNDPDAWHEAMLQDEVLRNTTKWASKSFEERFTEVVKRVRAVMPEASEPPSESPSPKTKEKAKAKLEKAEVRKPTTLSDIHGGDNPTSEAEQLQNLSPHELAQKLMSMPAHKAAAMRAELD